MRVFISRHEPAVEPALANRVPGWSGLREGGCQEHQEGPLWLAETQPAGQRRVHFQHDVDAAGELVAGEVERDVSRDIGEHLRFEDDRYSAGGSEQHGVGFRRSFQPCPSRFRLLFEVRDRSALVQMIAEPSAVAARRWEIDLEEQVQSAGERVLPSREVRRGAQASSLEQAGERLFPARAVIGVIQAHESRDHPEPFVFLHLPAQPRLSPRRPLPAANQFLIFSRLLNAGQVVLQVPVPLAGTGNGREVLPQLISREWQVGLMKHI